MTVFSTTTETRLSGSLFRIVIIVVHLENEQTHVFALTFENQCINLFLFVWPKIFNTFERLKGLCHLFWAILTSCWKLRNHKWNRKPKRETDDQNYNLIFVESSFIVIKKKKHGITFIKQYGIPGSSKPWYLVTNYNNKLKTFHITFECFY